MSFLREKIPLGAFLEVYGAETLACIAIGDQNRPEGLRFFCLLPSHSTQRELSLPSDHPLQPLTKPPLQRPSELYI